MNIKNSNGSGMENPEIMNTINSIDDNKKIFMYKDVALSLEDIQSRIDNIDSEDTRSEVLNDLSKLTPHPNAVNGDSDDLVNISWEKELNLDFPT